MTIWLQILFIVSFIVILHRCYIGSDSSKFNALHSISFFNRCVNLVNDSCLKFLLCWILFSVSTIVESEIMTNCLFTESFPSMNREQSQAFIKDCRSYMLEQLQKEVVYYLRDKEVLTEAEFKDIIDLVITYSTRIFH